MTDNPQHLLTLDVEDTLCLKAVHISTDGQPVIIGGANGAGKSASLQVIRMLIAGAREIPSTVIREGAKKSTTRIETEDYIITRIITADGRQRFDLKGKDGSAISKPQSFLDSLRGQTTFDPLAFARADKHEQLRIMRDLSGVDTTKIDRVISTLERDRTELARDVKRAKAIVGNCEFHSNAPDNESSIADLTRELKEAREVNSSNDAKRRTLKNCQDEINRLRSSVESVSLEIEALSKKKTSIEARILESKKIEAEALRVAEDLVDLDIDAIMTRINEAEWINRLVRENESYKKAEAELERIESKHAEAQAELESARSQRHQLIESARFPIDGLGFDDDGVTYQDRPFSAASRGEKMKISTAIGIADAKKQKLRVMLIDDAESLDDDNLREVLKMAAEAGVQPIIARRGEGATITIEDGEVK